MGKPNDSGDLESKNKQTKAMVFIMKLMSEVSGTTDMS